MPAEDFVYIADSGHAPYGERDAGHVIERSRAIVNYLHQHHHVQLLVVACNTATAMAIDVLRRENPDFPIVGVEPALKPATALTRTGRVGVMATRGTLNSSRFQCVAGHGEHPGPIHQPAV
jgi:glutamate racemase